MEANPTEKLIKLKLAPLLTRNMLLNTNDLPQRATTVRELSGFQINAHPVPRLNGYVASHHLCHEVTVIDSGAKP